MSEVARIEQFLYQHVGYAPVVIGLSGGIDSSVVAMLLARVVKPDRIHALIMPSRHTPKADVKDAEHVAQRIGVKPVVIPIQPLVDAFCRVSQDFEHALAHANLQARIRMSLLYGRANAVGGLVVGTGNKSELMTGYFTKHGDGGVDLLPIAHLYKTEVFAVAKELDVPVSIQYKVPSAGLFPGQSDEEDLRMSYQLLDQILQALEAGESIEGFPESSVERVQTLVNGSAHKRALAPSLL